MLTNLNRILARFPSQHFVYCFAYGSGVLQQAGRTDRAMVDMIFVVDDTRGFHRDNLAANPDHYSAIRHLGACAVARAQTAFGAHVYFNTHVTVDGVTFKYGVVDARDFRRDLHSWRTLYVAGRLHKPVLTLRDRGRFGRSIAANLRSAVHASLLQLPEKFAPIDLYTAVAGLSYTGDFRMIVGEDKHKVANIVRPQIERFSSLYAPVVRSMGRTLSVDSDSMEQDKSPESRLYHLRRLPTNLKNTIALQSDCCDNRDGDTDSALRALAERNDIDKIVHNGLCRIVFYSSLTQSIKGIATAGLLKSVIYSYSKLNKMFKSMFL